METMVETSVDTWESSNGSVIQFGICLTLFSFVAPEDSNVCDVCGSNLGTFNLDSLQLKQLNLGQSQWVS